MKKPVLIGLIAVVLVSGAIFAYHHVFKSKKVSQIEAIVPEDAIYYMYSYQPGKKLDEFFKNQFCKKISDLSFYKQNLAEELAKRQQVFDNLIEFFNNDSAIAVFSPGIVLPKLDAGYQPGFTAGKILFFSRMDAKQNIKKKMGELYLSFASEEEVLDSNYNGIKITSYKLPMKVLDLDMTLSYAVCGDILVFGNDLDSLKKVIDLHNGENSKSLLNNPIYKEVSKKYLKLKENSFFWTFVNHKEYFKEFLSLVLATPSQESSKMNEFFESFMQISKGMISYIDFDEERQGLICMTYQIFDKNKDKENFLDIFAPGKTDGSQIFKMVPPGILAYISLSGDVNGYWNYLKRFMQLSQEVSQNNNSAALGAGPQVGFAEILTMANTYAGLDIESDLLPLLGNNFAAFISQIRELSFAGSGKQLNPLQLFPTPVPSLGVMLEAKDRQAAEKLEDIINSKILDKLNADSETKSFEFENYQGVNMKLLPLKDTPLNLVVFSLDKYLALSIDLEFAKEIIDLNKNGGESLADDQTYYFDKEKILSQGSFSLFIDFQTLINRLAESKLIGFAKPSISLFTQGQFTPQDIDDIIDVLNDITLIAQGSKFSNEATCENILYIGIEGL